MTTVLGRLSPPFVPLLEILSGVLGPAYHILRRRTCTFPTFCTTTRGSGIHAQGLSTLGATMTPESGTYPQVPCSRLNCCASTKRHLREQSCVFQPSSKLLLQRRHDTLTACSPAIRVHVYKLVLVSRAFRASYRRLQPPGGSLTHSLVWSISRGVIYVHARRYRWVGISARAPRNVFCMLFLNGPCSGADRSTGLNNCA